MNIKKLIVEDVRCFAGRQELEIRPITFLVGENSTGKSTALACLQTLLDIISFPTNFPSRFPIRFPYADLDFNNEPYNLGAFADIVRVSRPRKESFRLGAELFHEKETLEYSLTVTERDEGSEPIIQEMRMLFTDGNEIVLKKDDRQVKNQSNKRNFQIQHVEGGKKKFVIIPLGSPTVMRGLFMDLFYRGYNEQALTSEEEELRNFLQKYRTVLSSRNSPKAHSFAPIRSKPQRTYDPIKEGISPEGSEMPMVLMNISGTGEKQWGTLKKRLIRFGKSSGLFTDIYVRKLGKSSDPFQLQIKVRGPKVNLIDVGYGVNQILPILVRIFNTEREGTTFLMQQPEVHLHPKGQAELSSLLIEIAKQQKQNFVIETHSDYMVDRARIDIRDGKIPPDDVSLIYFEPCGGYVKVHNIKFDEQGNLEGAPNTFRQFFLDESDRFLGLDES